MVAEIGRLIGDVQTSVVKNGKNGIENVVLNNTLAIYDGRGNNTYLDIVAWGKEALFIEKYFKRNDEIFVTGNLKNNTAENSNKNYVVLKVSTAKRVFGNGEGVENGK